MLAAAMKGFNLGAGTGRDVPVFGDFMRKMFNYRGEGSLSDRFRTRRGVVKAICGA